MNTDKHPAPGPTVKKENGKWTFYVFPDGQEREAGQYDTESAAKDARVRVLLQWGSNGKKYAFLGS
jgi:uncharacterized protein YfaP (DUF2135 family)